VGVIGDKGTLDLWNKTSHAAQRQRPPRESPSTDTLFDDVSQVSNGWQAHVPFLVMDSLTILGSVAGAAILGGPILAVALGGTTAAIVIQGKRSMRNVRDVDRRHHEAQVTLRERFRDLTHPDGWDLFRRMGAGLFGRNRFRKAAGKEAHAAAATRKPRLRAGFWTAAAELAFTVGVLAFAVATGNPLLALGPLIMATQAFGAAVRIPHNLLGVQPAIAASKRLSTFIDEPSKVVERANARDLPLRLNRGVEIDRVTFGYEQDDPVLQDLSLTLRPGTVTVLVGPNASGKSTLIDILQRKYDVRHGSIRIDGVDLRDAKLDAIDAVMGHGVPQHDHVLVGTLRENLLLAKQGASDDELLRVCKIVGLDSWMASMNHGRGLDVPVGRDTVSGGTRQRIALARLLLDPPAVALLDEPTSALDPNSRQPVLMAVMHELRQAGSAVLLAAHDLGVVRQADHVAVIEQGHIIEEGRPHELLRGDTALAKLFAQDQNLPQQGQVLWRGVNKNEPSMSLSA
jgi:ABC-type multidrug transport system fused ATPase/permease subunit